MGADTKYLKAVDVHLGGRTASGHLKRQQSSWITPYLLALTEGYSKSSSAASAGVHMSTVGQKRATNAEFARQEYVAYHMGTKALETIALSRIQDKFNPADGLLKHLLASRGISAQTQNKVTIEGGIDINHSISNIPLDKLSLETRQIILRELVGLRDQGALGQFGQE